MMMKILGKWLILFLLSYSIFAQQRLELNADDIISIPEQFVSKIGSGELIKIVSEKQLLLKRNSKNSTSNNTIQAVLYLENYPSTSELNSFQSVGINYIENSWTPPVYDHPYGFMFAEIPLDRLIYVLALDFVKKIASSEQLSFPQNNESDRVLNADDVWLQGWSGDGVKVAVLDSGLDTEPFHPDLPSSILKKDYSTYPTLDDDVENQVTGHGTHVTGSVLGRGVLSSSNIGNGGSPYKGVAPSAGLVFLKIGNDYSAGASTNAIVNAMDAAVNVYNVNLISLSYGSWDIYHDGSSPQEQKVDWCYSQGVPVFLAAGNEGSSARHFSGLLSANDSSEFVKVNITDAQANSTYLIMNLVWYDGLGVHKDLTVKYYNSSFQELTNVYYYTQTESPKGTESRISQITLPLPSGNGTYYLKVFNNSSTIQEYHLYEHNRDPKVKFDNPDPNYTIVSPANATYGFCVGAFTPRAEWIAYNGSNYSFGEIQNEIMSFSSRGPRIDGVQKPDIVAPGSAIISIRDRDVLTAPDLYWIDNDGNTTGDADYYVMQGTSMAASQCAGAAALFLNKFPDATPLDLYNALRNNTGVDEYTGTVPNSTFGYGKLDIYAAVNESDPLPVELTSFSAIIKNKSVTLNWRTETEVNNYGFEVQRSLQNEKWDVLGFVEGHGNSNSPKEYNFIDSEVNSAGTYSYRLKQIDNDGTYEFSKVIEVNFGSTIKFELNQNYPNPFNPSTTISFTLPQSGNVALKVFNSIGEEVITLTDGFIEAGVYTFNFNADGLPSGMYIYQLNTPEKTQVRKMILMK